MYKKLKKVSKSKKKLIAVVTVLFIGIVFANVLLTDTNKLTADVREEFNFNQTQNDSSTRPDIEDFSTNNLDEVDIEKLPVDIEDIEEVPFICTIDGKKYLAEYITREDVEEMKKKSDLRDSSKNYNQIIDGHGTGLAPPTEEELDSLVGKISIKEVISESSKSSDRIKTSSPSAVDLSSEIYFPPVKSQGGQGSCSTWANVYYAYGYMEARDNGWNAQSGNPEYLLSPAWVFNKLNTGSGGSSFSGNAKIMRDLGVATLNTMPYDPGDADSWGDEAAWREAPYHRSLDYTIIEYDDSTIIDTIKSLLYSKRPVTFPINAGQYANGLNKNTGDFILSSEEYDSTYTNHGNCFVGYDDSITEGNDVGAFRVVNSWGPNWMDGGFFWLTYEAFKEFGGRTTQYFYTDREDYEPSLIATWEFSSAPTRMDDIFTLGVGPYGDPLDAKTPGYTNDEDNLFPTFMALDISEFHSYYDYDHTENFYLELGSSTTPGIISSFLVERYEDGVLEEIAPQSPDVPKTTPGHVNTQFRWVTPGPISINDAGSNNWAWAKAQGLCAGYGTSTYPYVIEDLTIDCGGSGIGIKIKNSYTYFFTIEGCTISNSGSDGEKAGIKLINTNNGYITSCDCSQNVNGIFLDSSNYNIFQGNTVNENTNFGIWVEGSYHNDILSNVIKDNNYVGIGLQSCDYNTLWNNTIETNDYGLYLFDSDGNTVSENSFNNNLMGIYIVQSDDNTIYYNSIMDNSIQAMDYGTDNNWDDGTIGNYWNDYTGVDDNGDGIGDTPYPISGSAGAIDNYPIYIYLHKKISINDAGSNNWEWAKAHGYCSGYGTETDPYLIQGNTINCSGSGSGIKIKNSNVYFRIAGCTISNSGSGESDAGIKLTNTNNGYIYNNHLSQNKHGLRLETSNYNNIGFGNTLDHNEYGISLKTSNNNYILANTVNDNSYGIYLETSDSNTLWSNAANYNDDTGIFLVTSNDNTIWSNRANYNGKGIFLASSDDNDIISGNIANYNDYGILLFGSSGNEISENTLNYNANGIYLFSSGNTISDNTLNNNDYGIKILTGTNNLIYSNYFTDNSIQAQDDGTSNNWDDGTTGNFWDDYTGIDADEDGIGDTPYIISGSAGAIDNYPIWIDLLPISDFTADKIKIRKGKSVQFTFIGDEGNLPVTFLWDFGDGSTSNERDPTHTYNSAGKYTVSLTITDVDGDIVTEEKIDYITVTNPPKPVPGFTFYIFLISSIIGGASVICMLRRKVNKSVKITKKSE